MRYGGDHRVIVTGGGGFVGRAIVRRLLDSGINVHPLISPRMGCNTAGVLCRDALTLDLSKNQLELENIIPFRPDAVIHLAAVVPNNKNPDNDINARLTRVIDRNIAAAVSIWGCPAVYMSTCGLYERRTLRPKKEEDRSAVRVTSPYYAAKRAGEELFGSLIDSTIIRLGSPIGPGLRKGVVLSRFLKAANADNELNVWGTGSREQSFVDVLDIADGIIKTLENPVGGIFNIAAPHAVTMLELAKTVLEVVGKGRLRINQQEDPQESETARYDIGRAMKLLGFTPQLTLKKSVSRLYHHDFLSKM